MEHDADVTVQASPARARPWWRRWWAITLAVLIVLLVVVRAALPEVLRRVLVAQAEQRVAARVTVQDVDLWLLRGAVAIKGFELIGDASPAAAPSDDAPSDRDAPAATAASAASESDAAAETADPAASEATAAEPEAAARGAGEPTAAARDRAAQGTSAPVATTNDSAAPAPSGGPMPRVAFRRLYVDVGWRALLDRTLTVDEAVLEGPQIAVERRPDGTVVLPALRPTPPSEEAAREPPPPEEEAGAPWNVVVTAARLRDGRLELLDRVADPPQDVALSLDGFDLLGFHLLAAEAEQRPGQGTVEARFGDGTLRLDTSVATREQGFAVTATATLEKLPLDHLHVHLPQLGWSDFRGRLDGKLEVQLEPDALPVASGTIALRDVQVDVPGEDEPALVWRSLEVDVDEVDLAQRAVAVKRVALDGGGVLVRPLDASPLPLLPHDEAKGGTAKPVDVTVTPAGAPDAADAAATQPDAPSAFRWSVARVEVADTMAKVFLTPPPLDVLVTNAVVEGLSSEPGSRASVTLDVHASDGTLKVAGELGIDPLAGDLQVTIDGLALERLAAAAGVTPPVLRRGRLGTDLKLAFGSGPALASGTVTLAELDVAPEAGDEFGVAWQRLEIAIREARVPNVPPGAGGAGAVTGPIALDLTRVALASPRIRLTRTPEGIVLPAVRVAPGEAAAADASGTSVDASAAAADGTTPSATDDAGASAGDGTTPDADATPSDGAPADAAATTDAAERPATDAARAQPSEAGAPAAAAAAPAEPPVQVTLAELAIDDGEIAILDRAVQPFYRGRLTALELRGHDIRHPANSFRDLRLTAQAPGGTPLDVRAEQRGDKLEVDAQAKGLVLPQLNPYVIGASGYSIASGTFTLESKLRLDGHGYESESEIAFDDLDVAGAEGDTLFAQRFGVSLSLALALLRDVSGRIALNVPVSGDLAGNVRPDIAPIVADALSRALLNALASPLKLLGALSLEDGKVAAFAPEPIPFKPGVAEIADDGWWRIEQLAGVLASSPALRVELSGEAGDVDRRALQEAAVLADLQEDQGIFASLRNLPSRGTRNAVRDALEAKGRGEPVTLDEEQAAQLEEWVAAKPVGESELQALAAARAERLRSVLASDYGVPADRVVVREPAAGANDVAPQVAVQIGARG